MRPFTFRRGDSGTWDPGVTLLHVYVVIRPERDVEVCQLVARANAALSDFPLTPVESRWLHITLDQITDRPAAAIDPDEREELSVALRAAVAEAEPFDVTVGSLLSYGTGVIADLHPDEQLAALHQRVRGAIRAVRGPEAVTYPWGVQHLTLSYANGEADSDLAQRLLRRVRPGHARLRVDAVDLVDVRADHRDRTITWEQVARIPLGSG